LVNLFEYMMMHGLTNPKLQTSVGNTLLWPRHRAMSVSFQHYVITGIEIP